MTRPAPVADSGQLLTRREAAARAGVHPNTIRIWEGKGLLAPERVNIGNRVEVRIRANQLDAVAERMAAERMPKRAAGALELPAARLWEMVQEATQLHESARDALARAVEAKAAAEVAAAYAERERQAAEIRAAAAEARTQEIVLALARQRPPRRWYGRRRAVIDIPATPSAPQPKDSATVQRVDGEERPV